MLLEPGKLVVDADFLPLPPVTISVLEEKKRLLSLSNFSKWQASCVYDEVYQSLSWLKCRTGEFISA